MATPAFLRYLPARLKPLSSPAVWAPLSVFALLSIFIWEYHKNPDWFNRPQISNLNPDSTLTPEEQARLSEIDTLDLLLRNARTPSSSDDLSTSLINPTDPEAADSNTITPDRTLAGKENPFGAYEEQYKFPGSGSSPAVRTTPLEVGGLSLNSLPETPAAASSALSEALNRQQSTRNSASDSRASEGALGSDTAEGVRPSLGGSFQLDSTAIDTQPSSSLGRASSGNVGGANSNGVNTGNNGGSFNFPTQSSGGDRIPAPFIPTTTEMSPPVGTTGYQVPASADLPVFNVSPQQPSRSQVRQPFAVPAPDASAVPTPPTVNYTAPRVSQPEQSRRR